MRSAKLGQGTNSKLMVWPDFSSKSLDSSTSALAGSQAAQQRVRSAACAKPAARMVATVTGAVERRRRMVMEPPLSGAAFFQAACEQSI